MSMEISMKMRKEELTIEEYEEKFILDNEIPFGELPIPEQIYSKF